MKRITEVINEHSKNRPHAPAIGSSGGRFWSFQQLSSAIEVVSAEIQNLELGRHNRVALVMKNGITMSIALLAISDSCICAPMNPDYTIDEYSRYFLALKISILFTDDKWSIASKAANKVGIPVICISPSSTDHNELYVSLNHSIVSSIKRTNSEIANGYSLLLHTSGTTGKPKLIGLTHHNLLSSAKNISDSLHLNPTDRGLCIMPLFHIHGIVAGLYSGLFSGGSVICVDQFDGRKFFEWLKISKPTWYSAAPTMHRTIVGQALQHKSIATNSRLRFIRSCSSALDVPTATELETVFSAPVIEAYGMSEAAHQVCSNPLPPAKRVTGSVGVVSNSTIRIMDPSNHSILPAGIRGEIILKSPNVIESYMDVSDDNSNAFVNGWFRTGDLGFIDSDNFLTLTGRLKDVINRGGEIISPHEIDAVLTSHPDISQAVAFATPDKYLGENIEAVVVLEPDRHPSVQELQLYAEQHMGVWKVPTRIHFSKQLPTTSTGKIKRSEVAAKYNNIVPSKNPHTIGLKQNKFISAETEMEQLVAELWQDVFSLQQISTDTNFFVLGGDSVTLSLLISRLSESLDIRIPWVSMFDSTTITEQAQLVEKIILNECN